MTTFLDAIRTPFLSRTVARSRAEAERVLAAIESFRDAGKDENPVTTLKFGSLLLQAREGVLDAERLSLQLSHIWNDVTTRHSVPIITAQQQVVTLWKRALAECSKVEKEFSINRHDALSYVPVAAS